MKKSFIIFFYIGLFAVLPSFLQSLTTYAGAGAQGGSCVNGWTGTCQDVNTYSCNGTWDAGWYPWPCPYGGNNIICCVPPPTPPPPTSVTASCSPDGTNFTVNWTLPAGYSYAYARIYDATTGQGAAYSNPMTGNSYSLTNATPGHTYSYWVHTTYASGTPYSYEVPTAYTANITCPVLPACPNNPNPAGTIVSTGVQATASNTRNGDTATYGPQNTNDGVLDTTHYWDSGGSASQWIEYNLGAPQQVSAIQFSVHTGTGTVSPHTDQIYTGVSPNPTSAAASFSCGVTDGQVINIPINKSNVQYIRVNTSASGPWVAWNEISVFGSAPGSQTTTPGIIFTGNNSPVFGQGKASIKNWVIGGNTYPEMFNTVANPSTTTYAYVLAKANQAKIPITQLNTLSGCTNLANCTLPPNLPKGIYQANGNLSLNAFTFPLNRNYVFLINGDLTLLGNLVVPNGSTAFFTSSNNIIVSKNVGTFTNLFPLPSGQLQGLFSADGNFVIDGNNDCVVGKDKMLNVEGAIITNALGQGGQFRQRRDICGDNPKYPTFTIRPRLDMILNLPVFLMKQKTTFREDAP